MMPESGALQMPANHPALAGHFPRSPIAPGAWLLTVVEQECVGWLASEIRIPGIDAARFRAPLLSNQEFLVSCNRTCEKTVAFSAVANVTQILDGVLRLASPR